PDCAVADDRDDLAGAGVGGDCGEPAGAEDIRRGEQARDQFGGGEVRRGDERPVGERNHYGHLAVDSYQHAVSLLDALALERAVDAGWTPAHRPANPHRDTLPWPRGRHSQRVVDARWTPPPRRVATRADGRGGVAGTSPRP